MHPSPPPIENQNSKIENPVWHPSPAELEAYEAKQSRLQTAQSLPLPGPLLHAFTSAPPIVAGRPLRKILVGDWILLQQINSIALRAFSALTLNEEARAQALALIDAPLPGETPLQAAARINLECLETFLLFTQPPQTSRDLLANGRQHFRQAAAELADTLEIAYLQPIKEAIINHLLSSASTAVAHEPDPGPAGTFPSPPAPQTASAGGSTSSAS